MIEIHNAPKFKLTKNLETKDISKVKQHLKLSFNINIVFLTDDELLELNIKHLKHNYYTDILTFPIDDEDADIYISIDRVIENAGKLSEEPITELNRVMCHGLLHLANYKDESNKEKEEMRNAENKMLAFFVPRET